MPDSSTPSLAPTLTQAIKELCGQGYDDYDQRQFESALRLFYQAWLKLPKPQNNWREAGWVLTAIGDCYFRLHKYRQGCEALKSAIHCPDIQGNPFVHLRLGQCHFELGELVCARKHLKLAYDADTSSFDKESPKYLAAIAELITHV